MQGRAAQWPSSRSPRAWRVRLNSPAPCPPRPLLPLQKPGKRQIGAARTVELVLRAPRSCAARFDSCSLSQPWRCSPARCQKPRSWTVPGTPHPPRHAPLFPRSRAADRRSRCSTTYSSSAPWLAATPPLPCRRFARCQRRMERHPVGSSALQPCHAAWAVVERRRRCCLHSLAHCALMPQPPLNQTARDRANFLPRRSRWERALAAAQGQPPVRC